MKLLMLLSTSFPTLKATDEVLDVWHFALCDEDPQRMLLATRYLIKTRSDRNFMPTVAELISTAGDLSREHLSSVEEAWARGPRSSKNTQFDSDVWTAWGGVSRFGFLPDPGYCDDAVEAQRVLSFARKEFIELYQSKAESAARGALHITHRESVAALDLLGKLGVDTTKLLESK